MIANLGSPLSAALALLCAWVVIGLAGLLRPMSLVFAGRTLFPLGAACGLALALAALLGIAAPTAHLTLPIGLPDLPMHVRCDALSCVFLCILGATSRCV